MSAIRGAAVLALLSFWSRPARADSAPRIVERAHRVSVASEGGVTTLVVRRWFVNRGGTHNAFHVPVLVPPHATATSFRVRAAGRWQSGALLDSDQAFASYEEAQSHERQVATARVSPAIFHHAGSELAIEFAALRDGESVTVEYTLVAPSCYRDDVYALAYPGPEDEFDGGEDSETPTITWAKPSLRGRGIRLRAADELPEEHPDLLQQGCHGNANSEQVVSWSAPASQRSQAVSARWGSVTSGDQAVGRLEFEIAKELSALPRKATVVFVLDGSHSLGDENLAGQLALAKGYLAPLPDAKVEIVVFRHGAKRLFGELVDAPSVDSRLSSVRSALALGNGSDLDQGLALAARIASDAKGPVRIVALGDHRMRANLEASNVLAMLGTLPEQAVVHLVHFSPSAGELYEESGTGELATIAHAFGGELFEIAGSTTDAQRNREVLLHLVRPVRIDEVSFDAGAALSSPVSQLAEGVGFRTMVVGDDMPARIRLRGRLWSRPWTRLLERDDRFSEALPALALRDRIADSLDEDTFKRLAFAANAVTAHTAYLIRDAARRYWIEDTGFGMSSSEGFG